MNTLQLQRITKHGLDLLRIFPNATQRDPVKLCKALRRIETAANRRMCAACSVPCEWNRDEGEAMDEADTQVFQRLDKLLSWVDAGVPVIINRDPRGYSLKIDDAWMRQHPEVSLHRD